MDTCSNDVQNNPLEVIRNCPGLLVEIPRSEFWLYCVKGENNWDIHVTELHGSRSMTVRSGVSKAEVRRLINKVTNNKLQLADGKKEIKTVSSALRRALKRKLK